MGSRPVFNRVFVQVAVLLLPFLSMLKEHVVSAQEGAIITGKARDAKAEKYLLDFIASHDVNAEHLSYIARAQIWKVEDDQTVDSVFVGMSVPKYDFTYEARGTSSPVFGTEFRRFWHQTMVQGSRKIQRFGVAGTGDRFADSESSNKGALPKQIGTRGNYADLYNLTVASRADLLNNRVKGDFASSTYLENGVFLGSETGKSGQVVGIWQVHGEKGTVVDISFSKTKPHRPVRVVMRRAKGSHSVDDRKKLNAFSITQTEWKSISASDATRRVLPHRIQCVALNLGTDVPKYEMEVFCRWNVEVKSDFLKPDLSEVLFLAGSDFDWRSAVLERIPDDWNLQYAEAVQMWSDGE